MALVVRLLAILHVYFCFLLLTCIVLASDGPEALGMFRLAVPLSIIIFVIGFVISSLIVVTGKD